MSLSQEELSKAKLQLLRLELRRQQDPYVRRKPVYNLAPKRVRPDGDLVSYSVIEHTGRFRWKNGANVIVAMELAYQGHGRDT